MERHRRRTTAGWRLRWRPAFCCTARLLVTLRRQFPVAAAATCPVYPSMAPRQLFGAGYGAYTCSARSRAGPHNCMAARHSGSAGLVGPCVKGPQLLGTPSLGLGGWRGVISKAKGGEACSECMHALHRLGPAARGSCLFLSFLHLVGCLDLPCAFFEPPPSLMQGPNREPPRKPHLASTTCGRQPQMPAGMHVHAPQPQAWHCLPIPSFFFATNLAPSEALAKTSVPPPGPGGVGRRSDRLRRPAGLSEGHGQEEAGAQPGRPGLAGPGRQPRRPAAPARNSVSDASLCGSGGRHPACTPAADPNQPAKSWVPPPSAGP